MTSKKSDFEIKVSEEEVLRQVKKNLTGDFLKSRVQDKIELHINTLIKESLERLKKDDAFQKEIDKQVGKLSVDYLKMKKDAYYPQRRNVEEIIISQLTSSIEKAVENVSKTISASLIDIVQNGVDNQ